MRVSSSVSSFQPYMHTRMEASFGLSSTTARISWPMACSARSANDSSAGMASGWPERAGLPASFQSARKARLGLSMPYCATTGAGT